MFLGSKPSRLLQRLAFVVSAIGLTISPAGAANASNEAAAAEAGILSAGLAECPVGGGQNREYFFPTGQVIVEDNLVRVRVPASEDAEVGLMIGGREFREKFGSGSSMIFLVNAPGGDPGVFPFTEEYDESYDSYIEFIFVGASRMEKRVVDGREGLLVRTDGAISLFDPSGAFPFSTVSLRDAIGINFFGDPLDGPFVPPHSPKRVVAH